MYDQEFAKEKSTLEHLAMSPSNPQHSSSSGSAPSAPAAPATPSGSSSAEASLFSSAKIQVRHRIDE